MMSAMTFGRQQYHHSRQKVSKTTTLSSISKLLFQASIPMLALTALVTSLVFFPAAHAFTTGGEHPCTYDFELQTSTMKISCPGSPSTVNVYADTANLQAQDLKDGGSYHLGGTPGGTNSRSQGQESRHSYHRPRGQQSSSRDPFSSYVWNASKRLDDARRSLTGYETSLENISVKMAEGKLNLDSDMDKLRRDTETAEQLKQHIVAAMTNQFNFMRSLLVNRNQELQNLVDSLSMLVEVTSEGLHSALDTHRMTIDRVDYLNNTLVSVRSMLTSELRKKDKRRRRAGKQGKKSRPKDLCPKEISAIGAGTYREMKYPVGSYMTQSNNPNQYRSVYVIEGSGPQDEIEVYDTPQDVAFDIPAHYIPLPYYCSGTGHAVYRRHLYCHQHGTNLIVKFHLKRYEIIADLPLPGAGYSNQFPYTSGENTDIDMAVDELGLWAIYATNDSAGKVVITKIDHKHMELGKTWMTSYPKRSLGNAFMICGTLYATDSHRDVPTYIRYVYNTETGEEQLLQPGEMPFLNSALVGRPSIFAHNRKVAEGGKEGEGERKSRSARQDGRSRRRRWRNHDITGGESREGSESDREHSVAARQSNSVMLSYDFRTSSLLSWNNGRLETFPVYFREDD